MRLDWDTDVAHMRGSCISTTAVCSRIQIMLQPIPNHPSSALQKTPTATHKPTSRLGADRNLNTAASAATTPLLRRQRHAAAWVARLAGQAAHVLLHPKHCPGMQQLLESLNCCIQPLCLL